LRVSFGYLQQRDDNDRREAQDRRSTVRIGSAAAPDWCPAPAAFTCRGRRRV